MVSALHRAHNGVYMVVYPNDSPNIRELLDGDDSDGPIGKHRLQQGGGLSGYDIHGGKQFNPGRGDDDEVARPYAHRSRGA